MSTRAPVPTVAVTVALLGGAVLAVGSALPVVSGGSRGFAAVALLVVLALLPVVLAALCLLPALFSRRRPAVALGVLTGLAALAPGRVVLDLRFAVDAAAVSRPALYVPDTLSAPGPASGLWLMIGGQVGLLAAGVLAMNASTTGAPAVGAPRRGLVPAAACVGTLTAIGSLMAPFASDDAYLVPQGALERGPLGLTGSLLFAVALPLAAVAAAGTGRPLFSRGCFLGLGLGVLAASLPNLVAALVMSELSVRPGAVVTLVGALGLLSLVAATRDRAPVISPGTAPVPEPGTGPVSGPGTATAGTTNAAVAAGSTGGSTSGANRAVHGARGSAQLSDDPNMQVTHAGYARMPSLRRFEIAVAVAAVATCAAALAGSLTAQVTSSIGDSEGIAPRWPLLISGVVTGVLAAMLVPPRMAGRLRPMLSVVWVSVPVTGMSILGTGMAAGETHGVLAPGPGVLWTVLAIVLAAVTACLSAVAGVLDREDMPRDGFNDPAGRGAPGISGGLPRGLAIVGAVLAVLGFALPASGSADNAVPGLVANLTTGSWGLLAGLFGVLAAVGIAMYSRPARAAAVLAGAACVLALRTVEWPLATLGTHDTGPAVGWWFALLGTLVLVVTAGTVVAGRLPSRNTARAG